MPAGDAGLERQTLSERVRERVTVAHLRINDVLSDRDAAQFHEILDNVKDMAELIDQLLAQLAAQQAVVDAAREAAYVLREKPGGEWEALEQIETALRAMAAQPEGERA